MKILFVYPSGLDSHGKPIKYKKAYLPPLSLSILARLTPDNHQVHVINDCVEYIDFNNDYDVVGITVLTFQAPRAYQIAKEFRRRGTKVVLGGIHPSFYPEEAIKYADSVVLGEAEDIWAQVISDAENGRLQPFYKSEELPDLEDRCIPKWDDFNLKIYRRSFGRKKMPRMPIYTTKGCIHNCKYCSVTKFFGRTYRFKPVSLVLEEIDSINADSYFFVDDNIVCTPDYSEELFRALAKKKIRWFSQASVQILNNPDLIDLAAKAGCRSLFFGIESISRTNLKSVRKAFNNPAKYTELIYRMEAVGIRPWFSMILGFDYDDLKQLAETVEFLKKANVSNVVLFILTPLPGTELFDELETENRIFEKDWTRYDTWHVVFKPKHFESKQLERQFWEIYRDLYSVKSIIRKMSRILRNPHPSKLSFINDLRIQIYTHNQIKRFEHPFSMGIGMFK